MFITRNLVTLAFGLLIVGSYAPGTPSIEPFRLELSPTAVTVNLGQEIDMMIVLTNTSDAPLVFRNSFTGDEPEFFYNVVIHSTTHTEIQETAYEREVKGHGTVARDYNSKFVTLKPGDRFQERIHLSKLFKFTEPGSYSVEVERSVEDLNQKAKTVKSNATNLTIIP